MAMNLFRTGRRERGAALIEAALVLPILLLLTMGIWSTARAWNLNNTLEHAAREAARFGATIDPWDDSTSPGEILAIANADMAAAAIDTSAVTNCIDFLADTESPSCDSHVNGTGTDQVFVKLTLPNHKMQFIFFSFDVNLSGTAVSRFEAS
jgi:Flp pilus assembly protein TadG